MRKLFFVAAVVGIVASAGCNNHPFQRGYTCTPVYGQPTYTAPTAVPTYAAPPPTCQPVMMPACTCN